MYLVACQPTPTDEIHTVDGASQAQETVSGEKAVTEIGLEPADESAQAAEIREEATAGPDGDVYEMAYTTKHGVEITINATVTAPADRADVVRAEPVALEQKTIAAMLPVFAGSADTYVTDASVVTREEYEARIAKLQEMLDGMPADDPLYAQTDDGIAYLAGKISDAPSDSSITRRAFSMDGYTGGSLDVCFDGGHAEMARFTVQDQRDAMKRYVVSYANYPFHGSYSDHVPYEEKRAGSIGVTYDAALAQAQELLGKLDLGCMQLAYVQMGFAYNYDSNTEASEPGSYKFFFTRTLDGLATPYVEMNAWTNNQQADSSDYRASWTAEYVSVEVDGTGIVHFMYMNPVSLGETVSGNVTLLPLEEAVEIFLANVDTYYAVGAGQENAQEIAVNEIILGYQFQPVQDNLDAYDLVPCWVFIGEDAIWSAGFHTRTSQMTISAIDGSTVR